MDRLIMSPPNMDIGQFSPAVSHTQYKTISLQEQNNGLISAIKIPVLQY